MEELQGGREGQIFRSENRVYRPRGKWSETVHHLLSYIAKNGFRASPKPFGFDDKGNEILSFVDGEVFNYPLKDNIAAKDALISAASLLRSYHDASSSFLSHHSSETLEWMLPAHPAPRVWDVAYALYCWAPFKTHKCDAMGDLVSQSLRAKQFCDAYGLPEIERQSVVQTMIDRVQALVDHMHSEARNGNQAFIANINDGHHLAYLADIEYLQSNGQYITEVLVGKKCL
ncbi:phosphotransferase [Vibrio parahaemolyticus]|uniref:phosphotransferase n=1 Tax=Vibrio parahaemolyticus TaxID=670 RepID=UPI001E30E0F0|nr:phosphotransferase [Vibrio parahaemolyticus]